MQARMKNPAMIFPEAMQALLALNKVTEKAGLPSTTLGLVHLRVSHGTQRAGNVLFSLEKLKDSSFE